MSALIDYLRCVSTGLPSVIRGCPIFGAALLTAGAAFAADAKPKSGEVKVDAVLVTLIEQADVSARESGVLSGVAATEGQLVDAGDLLAQLEDVEAQMAQTKAKLEFEIAGREARNDIKVRLSKKALETAKVEVKRAKDSRQEYKKSVSQSELDALQLAADQAELELEQSKHDLEIAELTRQLKDNELQIANRNVERRKITAPLAGVVVQVKRHPGEWVQPGELVARVLRVDRMRAEVFLSAKQVTSDWNGCDVTLVADVEGQPRAEFAGKLVFVSPEINPVNGQVRVWAEIENRDLLLRPGLEASLVIHPGQRTNSPQAAKR